MNIEKKITETKVKVESTIVHYSSKEVAELILQDLKNKGYVLNPVTLKFHTEYKTTQDEWGMNTGMTSYFLGAYVEVQDETRKSVE